MSNKVKDECLEMAADCIFKKYDTDENGYLDADEVYDLIKDSRHMLGIKKKITDDEVNAFMRRARTQRTGKITLGELTNILKNTLP